MPRPASIFRCLRLPGVAAALLAQNPLPLKEVVLSMGLKPQVIKLFHRQNDPAPMDNLLPPWEAEEHLRVASLPAVSARGLEGLSALPDGPRHYLNTELLLNLDGGAQSPRIRRISGTLQRALETKLRMNPASPSWNAWVYLTLLSAEPPERLPQAIPLPGQPRTKAKLPAQSRRNIASRGPRQTLGAPFPLARTAPGLK